MDECCVCLGEIEDPCSAPCGHIFCQQCILRDLTRKPPEWSGSCPLCRAHISVYNLRDSCGVQLAEADVGTIFGCVFVQSGTVGCASYHFDAEDDCYISYTSVPPDWRLDDGRALPAKKPWSEARYDAETRTFRGSVEWEPAFGGDVKWDYEIIFAEDFAGVIGGRVDGTARDGTTSTTPFVAPWEDNWDDHLGYLRWTRPSTTIFGSVYVQGMAYQGVLEGIASYHFDSMADCYISYANAPDEWRLDDGSPPPAKKPFNDVSYDAHSRTFRGVVCWNPAFAGAVRWEYEIVFAEDFRSIASGQMQPFGQGERKLPAHYFGDPTASPSQLRAWLSRSRLYYVQKPAVLNMTPRLRTQLPALETARLDDEQPEEAVNNSSEIAQAHSADATQTQESSDDSTRRCNIM